jgi:hypothetical protein
MMHDIFMFFLAVVGGLFIVSFGGVFLFVLTAEAVRKVNRRNARRR